MRSSRFGTRLRRALAASILAAAAAAGLLALPVISRGQAPLSPFGVPPQQPSAPPALSTPPAPKPAPPAAVPVVARVDGREITQADFDRVALPYYQRLKAELGDGFQGDVRKTAAFNVLDELVRRHVLAIESARQKIEVTQEEIDASFRQEPFFLTNGKFDPVKFESYKTSPASNYLQMLPRVRENVAIRKLDEQLRKRFTPSPAQVQAEWAQRTDQVRFKVLPLLTRDMPLEPEATEAEWVQYHRTHPDEFTRRARVRFRYLRLPIPFEGDSARPAALGQAMARATAVADSLRRRTLPDSAAEFADTGLFDAGVALIPGLGRDPALGDTLGRAERDSMFRVVGPYVAREAVIVGVIAERQPRHVQPLREVTGDVKRRADAEKRRLANEADRRAFWEANRDRWRGPRVSLTRVTLNTAAVTVKPPAPAETDRWYAEHGRALFGLPDSSGAWLPPITDSLRTVARTRITEERHAQQVADAMGRIVSALRLSRDAREAARAEGAAAETLSLTQHAVTDTIFNAAFVDTLVASAVAAKGAVQGPRVFGPRAVAWRIDAVDTSFVPPYELARSRSDQAFAEERKQKDATEALAYFEAHRDDFRTAQKYGLDCVAVRIPPADSVSVPEAAIRQRYDANPAAYRREEQVKARHILFMTRGLAPDQDKAAKARADSLLAAIRTNGGDFAELAKRFSQEPGAATGGGDLGWFGRGRMVKEFDTAVFALKPGEIGPVVKTQFGYHIIKVEDRKAAGVKPFDEVRNELRTQLAQARGDSAARRSAESLRRRLVPGADAKALAAPYGGVVSASPVAAGEPLPGIGLVQDLAKDLPGMKPGTWAPETYRVGNQYVVVRLRESLSPRPAAFEEVKAQAIEEMKNAKRREVLARKVEAIRAGLAAGASLDSLAAPFGGLKDSGLLGLTGAFIPGLGNEPVVVKRALALKPGEVTDTLQTSQGVAWIRVEQRKTGDSAAFQAASAQIVADGIRKQYDAWFEEKRKTVRVEILRPDLRGPRPSLVRTVTTGG